MQRRAAALWVAFFLVIGAASYTLVATAQEPGLSADGMELSGGDSFTVDGQEYTVASIETKTEGGDHGAPEETVREATIAWTVEDGTHQETWDNGSVIEFDGNNWTVTVESSEDPASFTLTEKQNRTAMLEDDPNADDETVTHEGEEHVVVEEDGEEKLVPAEEYFDPETREYQEGETVDHEGNETTFTDVSNESVTLEWTAPKDHEATIGNLENVTLNGQKHFAYFPSDDSVLLSTDFDALSSWQGESQTHQTHVNGLWGVSILSFAGAALLLMLAFLPPRY